MSAVEKILVNGAELAVRVDGDAGKPWMVLSNSLACTMDLALPDPEFIKTHRVVRYDTRGHGQSSAPAAPYSMDLFASDLVGVMDHFGIERADIIGLSMGGMTALGVAINHPTRVNRIACCAGRANSIPPFVESWNTRIAMIREAGGMKGVVDFTIERWFTQAFRDANPDIVREAEAMILAASADGYIACAEALKGLDYKRSLGTIKAPALFVAGADDGGAPPAELRDMASLTPGAEFVEIAPASHIIAMENPVAFNAAITAWLSKTSAA